MADDIEAIKSKRRRAKAALTRISNSLDKPESESFGKVYLQIRIDKLEEIYANFDSVDAKLPVKISEIEQFEKTYFETKAKLQTPLDKINFHMQMKKVNLPMQMKKVNLPMQMNNMASCSFKLPKINIKSFNGKYNDRPAFKDMYVSMIHHNEALSNIQKFHYISELLSDEPATVIKHIPFSEASYIEAWEKCY
ncbi:hypothetical protein AVEN_76674-1 [Araneus ventricosus]|uniref:Uncharacterized protein n=1 Tax=Araneus ventricosus TaxID=182803 RepID=A0A4Y2BP09_ARAVE|nr:hypothetical protein AVEN_76674-1 [Araneus ventricosus]